jgi:ABC-type Mn2+/Zn2+ transport system permease subunit
MMAIGVLIGVVSTYLGLLLSYTFDTAGGATIVLVATAIFFTVLLVVNVRAGVRVRAVTVEDLHR